MIPGRVVAYSALYGLYVLYLHTTPGPWRAWKQEAGAAIDPWFATHLAWGALAKLVGIGPGALLGLGALNEIVEAELRRRRPDLLWGTPESLPNVAMDLVGNQAGWWVMSQLVEEVGGRKV